MGYEKRAQQPPLRLFGGLNTTDSELGLPGVDSPSLVNVDLHPEGSVRMRNGTLALPTPTGETQIDAVIRRDQPEQSRGWIYVIADGTIYRAPEPGVWAWLEPTHASGTAAMALVAQLSYGRENSRYYDESGSVEHPSVIYLPRSNGAPLILLGQTSVTGDVITMPTGVQGPAGVPGSGTKGTGPGWGTNNWPTHMRLMSLGHGPRMYAWGFPNNPNMLAYSELSVPYNYLQRDIDDAGNPQPLIDGGHADIALGDGDRIMSVADMFSYKVIFKENRTLIYTGDPGNSYNDNFPWTLQAEFPVGCVSDQAWVKIGNDIMFWSNDGPRILSAVQEYGDLANSNAGWKINNLTKTLAPGYHENVRCYHDATNMRVIWMATTHSHTGNNISYVYYYQSEKWAKWTGPISEMNDVLLLRSTDQQVERFIGGTLANGIVQLQSGFTDIVSGATQEVASEYITNWINIGEIADSSRALWLDVMFGDDGPLVDIYYQTDLDEDWTQINRIVRSFGGGGSAWGKLVWGTSPWGVTARAFNRYEFDSLNNLVRFKFTKTGSQGFEVMGYRIEARQKGARA